MSLQGRGYSRRSLVRLNIQVVHSASVMIPSSPGTFIVITRLPPAAPPPGRGRAGHGIGGSVLHGTPASQCGLYFGLVIWVNGSILQTDGPLPGTPEKSGFQTSKAGGQRLGKCAKVNATLRGPWEAASSLLWASLLAHREASGHLWACGSHSHSPGRSGSVGSCVRDILAASS